MFLFCFPFANKVRSCYSTLLCVPSHSRVWLWFVNWHRPPPTGPRAPHQQRVRPAAGAPGHSLQLALVPAHHRPPALPILRCSWRPVNTTSGLLCEMTNSADLPEAFLLVSCGQLAQPHLLPMLLPLRVVARCWNGQLGGCEALLTCCCQHRLSHCCTCCAMPPTSELLLQGTLGECDGWQKTVRCLPAWRPTISTSACVPCPNCRVTLRSLWATRSSARQAACPKWAATCLTSSCKSGDQGSRRIRHLPSHSIPLSLSLDLC